ETPQTLESRRLGASRRKGSGFLKSGGTFFEKTAGKLAFLRIYVQSERELNLSLFYFWLI
ncbi:hypothetical protein ABES21_16320, partial [Peribacillus frigoritolerans]|uniref:hypothetical protein n=1 Tax=Peribacillus frigoritolerans TaxID=450367 RepID=UPI003D275E44